MKCIIPACGYGTRMNMKPDESKEMILEKVGWGDYSSMKPIIDYSLRICKWNKIEPIVITRPDKKDLIEYLEKEKVEYMIHQPKEGEEWQSTVLASQKHWDKDNLLILPDTRFFPQNDLLEEMKNGLELGHHAMFAIHKVKDPENWGIIKNYHLIEKPKELTGTQWAWGLIAFRDYYGEELFTPNYQNKKVLRDVGFTYLKYFDDITRGEK